MQLIDQAMDGNAGISSIALIMLCVSTQAAYDKGCERKVRYE